ncbi:hypothetical protein [Paracoccus tegillarcae]|uniref:Lipoprotein n=1 Tax=Paracoccus tegillarcae TaxID=1529068 RepID=A0A2K9END9_9RHOB|nr:hypothetical protein [Paracoccus tegillarcae]AUH34977.1 hypothetical protein CUV01_17760 [Paracoccus tegillarcae]
MIQRTRPIAALGLIALTLAACAQPIANPAELGPNAPVRSAVPESPYRAATSRMRPAQPAPVIAAPIPVAPAVPTGPSGPLDARTGLHQSALVSVSGSADSQFIVLFRPGQTDSDSIDTAPGKLCGATGVASSRTNSPGSGSAMPGVQTMIVKCGAA